jgi:SprB repeat/CHU_C Type IX secretion signal domain
MQKPIFTVALFLLGVSSALFAQPANNECSGAIRIANVRSFCSRNAEYTNTGATASNLSPASCFGATQRDVWFTFVAVATDVTITVRGATAQGRGGTLVNPQVAVYLGDDCNSLSPLGCQSAVPRANIVELYQGGLFIGSTYTIRVQGSAGANGTFQLCVNNYNPPAALSSDCPTASLLCDKSPFVVRSVTGAGRNTREMDDAECFRGGAASNLESNSTWFAWTCSRSGPLEFTLTPLNSLDDLDFVLYELPNGVRNCNGKRVLRCMASGETQGQNSDRCLGPTGLRSGDSDTEAPSGCPASTRDAFLAPFNMVAGRSYALVINNFTSTGNGFSIEFGGTGEFQGPEAKFTTLPEKVCLGTPIQFTDASVFPLGTITSWRWSFGETGTPRNAATQGPHTVTFTESGLKSIALTIETNLGCRVTDIQTVEVLPSARVDTAVVNADCDGRPSGQISLRRIRDGKAPFQFSWRGGPFTSDSTLRDLPIGVYSVVIKDANNCETKLDIPVKERELMSNTTVKAPLCNGQSNGEVTIDITNGRAPYQFDWGSGFVANKTQGGFAAGSYTFRATDASQCKGTFAVTITEPTALTLMVDTAGVTCFGARDGKVKATTGGGTPDYTYTWSNASRAAELTRLAAGTYSVTVTDKNGCTIIGQGRITEPGDIGIRLVSTKDLTCNGLPTGEIQVAGIGGRPPFTFSTDGRNFKADNPITGLGAGNYSVIIKDAAGCVDSVRAALRQPPPLRVVAQPKDTLVDLGTLVQTGTSIVSLKPVVYTWTPTLRLSCTDCPDPVVTAIGRVIYSVKITDTDGCTATDSILVRVTKKRPLYVPNVIAPQSATESSNGRFTVFGGAAVEGIAVMRIYDRWGELVFEAKDVPHNEPRVGWDGTFRGKPVEGVFVYMAVVRFLDGQEILYEGDVTVVR